MAKKRKKKVSSPINRSKRAGVVIFFTISLVLLLLSGHFVYVAATRNIKGRKLSETELRHFMRDQAIQPHRGNIFDASGQALAENTTTYNLYAIVKKGFRSGTKPLYVVNKQKTARILAPILGMKEADVLNHLQASPGTFQVEFGSAGDNLSIAQHDKIVAAKLPGLNFVSNAARFYPNGVFASQLIGLVANNNDGNQPSKMTGIMGLEQSLNRYLTGKAGIKTGQQTAGGVDLTSFTNKKVKNGDDVYLTLDYHLQFQLEHLMSNVFDKTKPQAMTAILANAKTGAILAATQRPTFNASTKAGLSKMWDNLLVQDPVEPGSTMKTFTLSAAIDSGHWNPNAIYKSGTLNIGNQKVFDFNRNMGNISYREGFARSSNVAFAKTEMAMGPSIWRDYLTRFNFLKATQTMLPNEAAGSMVFNEPIEQANTAFGQGIEVTPMQIVQALTAVANNGRMVRPYIVSKIVNPDSKKTAYEHKVQHLSVVMRPTTAQQVRKDMIDVVNLPDGTARIYSLAQQGIQIAAKTGTAQIAINGKYTNNYSASTHSVEVLVPADDPQFIFYMYLRQPKEFIGGFADATINTVFHPLILSALNDAKTSVAGKNTNLLLPNFVGQTVDQARQTAQSNSLTVVIAGDADKKISWQSVGPSAQVITGQKIFLRTSGKIIMPDMKGWSISDISTFSSMAKLNLSYSGTGQLVSQNIKPGSNLTKGQKLEVNLQ
ncbi:penicillin-binding protein [Oenococcus sp.]|uniref:penicillin-binding protein n=1 Tax=Oenococcus sp. TaxID=1979414 RepID=UPI0039ED4B61